MDIPAVLTSILALAFIAGLIALTSVILRKYASGGMFPSSKSRVNRLCVKETKIIDPRHKLVLVGRDNTEHLLVISASGAQIIETGIKAPVTKTKIAKGSTANAK